MNKKALSIVLALAITLCLSIAVMASTSAPSGTVNIDPIADITWDQDQTELTQEVTGYVEFDSSNDGPKLETLQLKVQKGGSNEWTTIDSKNYTESTGISDELTERSNDLGLEFNFEKDWTIEAEGTYKLRVIATFTDLFSKEQATITVNVTPDADEAVVEIEDLGENEDLDENDDADTLNEDGDNGPAAPAVAGKILKAGGFKNHYDGGNFIADVAKEMGPNGEFQGVQKSDTEYEKTIESFLLQHDEWDKKIIKEKHQNQSNKK